MDTTLFVDAWGIYFRQILSPGWVEHIAKNCCGGQSEFKDVIVLNNNIPLECSDEFYGTMLERLNLHEVTKVINVENAQKKALDQRGLKLSDFSPLFFQSTSDLVAIHQCNTQYMVYFSGDAVPWGRSMWVNEGIELLEKNADIMIVNPTWNGFYEHARRESFDERPAYFMGRGFSDQCYLARTDDLRGDIYRETNAEADKIYCPTHGNTFEKRVSAYIRNHCKIRATLKSAAYLTRP